jgi:hypothetical protein
MTMEPTQLVYFFLSINLRSGCLHTELHCKKTGQEPHHAVPTLSVSLPMTHYPVVASNCSQRYCK